ncbi:MAG TPA: SDR family NAD(P)-dependent oxidoreductase [Symbiobacteriaceae bacterium]|jgi:3-oxoacyl-[acyl-carrier protein] reductase|nr:SDR family NAD(P)-dependent oxidoreductase [Symbiobacteriaceae bacterium]
MDFDFRGKTAIVTGAAHGIGRAICTELGRRGALVYATDVLAEDLEETRRTVEGAGGVCQIGIVDVTRADQVNAFVAEAAAAGGVQILINVAGGVCGQVHQPIEQVSDAHWEQIVKVNLTGAFYFTRAVAPFMKEKRYGRIINISSGAGRTVSLTGIQAYASAKAGQIGFSRQTAHELGAWGITVNNIAPGFVRSNPSTERQWESYGPEGQKALVDSIALKRLGTAEDIAYGVLFFASDFASWVTGQTISIDGGKTML